MTTDLLIRVETVPDSLIALDRELSEAAYKELDYRPAAREVAKTANQRALYEQLFALGLKPFDPASVERYKNRMIRAKWYQLFRWQAAGVVPCLAVALALLKFAHSDVGAMIGSVVFSGGAILWACGAASFIEPSHWLWDTWHVSNYHEAVPSHVLQTALTLKRTIPNALLLIEAFTLRRPVRVYADPFLLIRVGDPDNGGASAYIEVWDEPTFK